ncbi:hypothetical protein DL766_005503 [Monosporascus sp. MC13-8B]|uniref:Uncharacterized protein n=1 Tax=Monosporascus cannonballus TaxID=155416 RepID=A0ABY0H9Z5_9PEZI|nr:hypothetical protein DL763_010361 [Monosporascus cannonballus]RYO87769.1 hypothetical protein DL762_004059 [Monosporascus cannonballus]RYP29216.1 hypothetical protein DL766_005503 [Monosporascus sp. MC13-8B]
MREGNPAAIVREHRRVADREVEGLRERAVQGGRRAYLGPVEGASAASADLPGRSGTTVAAIVSAAGNAVLSTTRVVPSPPATRPLPPVTMRRVSSTVPLAMYGFGDGTQAETPGSPKTSAMIDFGVCIIQLSALNVVLHIMQWVSVGDTVRYRVAAARSRKGGGWRQGDVITRFPSWGWGQFDAGLIALPLRAGVVSQPPGPEDDAAAEDTAVFGASRETRSTQGPAATVPLGRPRGNADGSEGGAMARRHAIVVPWLSFASSSELDLGTYVSEAEEQASSRKA